MQLQPLSCVWQCIDERCLFSPLGKVAGRVYILLVIHIFFIFRPIFGRLIEPNRAWLLVELSVY